MPTPTEDPRHLYRHADAALSWGKRHGRTTVVVYDPRVHGQTVEARPVAELADGIDAVLAARAVRPVYQPIFSMTTGRPIGYEGLVRPTRGAPFDDAGSLFQAAEAVERTVELDLLCLEVVAGGVELEEAPTWRQPLAAHARVRAVPRQRAEGDLPPPRDPLEQIVLELTTQAVENLDQLRTNVAACRQAGYGSPPTTWARATQACGC